MARLSTLDQTALSRRIVQIDGEIEDAHDVLIKLDLIQERISLRTVLDALQDLPKLSLV